MSGIWKLVIVSLTVGNGDHGDRKKRMEPLGVDFLCQVKEGTFCFIQGILKTLGDLSLDLNLYLQMSRRSLCLAHELLAGRQADSCPTTMLDSVFALSVVE